MTHSERYQALDTVLQQALTLTDAAGGAILLLHADQLEPVPECVIPDGYTLDVRLASNAVKDYKPILQSETAAAVTYYMPIIAYGAATLGVMGITCPQPPSDKEIALLHLFAEQAATLISQQRMIDSLRQNVQALFEEVEELEFIRQADHELSSRLDPTWIVKLTLDWALRRTMADAGVVIGIDPIQQQIGIMEANGFTDSTLEQLRSSGGMLLSSEIMTRIFSSRTSLVINNPADDPSVQVFLAQTQSILMVPLISHRRTVGAIRLDSRRTDCFDTASVSFIEGIAGMAAIALDNAQLLQQAEQLADDMALIHNGGRTMSASLEWDIAVKSVAQGMALCVRGATALLYGYDSDANTAKLLASYHRADQVTTAVLPTLGSTWDLNGYSRILTALKDNQLMTFEASSASALESALLEGWQVPAAAVAPLVAQDSPMGFVVLLKTYPPYQYAPSEVFVIESIATQAAAVLRQATLYTEVLELETLKSEMIGMASHDLRGPISNALGYLGLIEADLADGRQDDLLFYIDAVKRSVGTMDALVQDLLNLEKVESQGAQNWESFLLDGLVKEVADEQQSPAHLKMQSLSCDFALGVHSVQGNRTHLRQAVTNLVSNAIKYTPDQGTIRARVYSDKHQRRVYFEVVDNGLGIPANRQGRIFQRFYRAKQAGTENISGTGLGLSLVKSVVERCRGGVYFSSEDGKGSTFGFWLPLRDLSS